MTVIYGKRFTDGPEYRFQVSEKLRNVTVGGTYLGESPSGLIHVHVTKISDESVSEKLPYLIKAHRPLPFVTYLEARMFAEEKYDGMDAIPVVYGKHHANGPEFCWRIRKSLASEIVIGDKILVYTKKGIKKVTVTDIGFKPREAVFYNRWVLRKIL